MPRSHSLTSERANAVALDALTDAFNAAFAGYLIPMWYSADALASMIAMNDVHLDASLLLRDASGAAVAIGLLGIRGDRGWVAGMGVIPTYRGQGIGRALLESLIAQCRARGLRHLQLEVLDENRPARALYTALGFREVRPLSIYVGPLRPSRASSDYRAWRKTQPPLPIYSVTPETTLKLFEPLRGVTLPWQREAATLRNMGSRLTGVGIRAEADSGTTGASEALRAYALAQPQNGGLHVLDIVSCAETPAQRIRDAVALLGHLTQGLPASSLIRAINVPPGDLLGDTLTRLRCPVVTTQREMHLAL